MATYAAFKHVELHKVGYGKNRVPNAPRGCIGEIFNDGGANGNGGKGGNAPDTPSRPKDTHSRLFGPSDRPQTAVRDNLKSNISFGEESPRSSSSNGHNTNGQSNGQLNGQTNGQSNGHSVSPKEANPLSGENYKTMNGEINTVTALNGNGSRINHNRVPPGGYSSGLW